jgi:regulator of sigma D
MVSEAPKDRRERTRKEIRQLIENRSSMLAQYYNLVKITEELDWDASDTLELVDEFCQNLVDYLAVGHFEIYRRIEEGNERRDEMLKLADQIMPRINATTQIAVAFNDLYDSSAEIHNGEIAQLPAHLSRLGEQLAIRIDLEDQFINCLLTSGSRPNLTSVTI